MCLVVYSQRMQVVGMKYYCNVMAVIHSFIFGKRFILIRAVVELEQGGNTQWIEHESIASTT